MPTRLCTLLLALWALLWAGIVSAADVPPAPSEHVTDRAGVLTSAEREDLNARLRAYEEQTGRQMIVWIDRTTDDATIEDFAVRAFAAWKVGRKGLDDGVALFLMVDDHKVRIEVGYGLEDRVTDLVASQIIRDAIVPRIVAGDFDGAVRAGVEQLADAAEGRSGALPAGTLRERGPPPDDSGATGGLSPIWMIALGIGFLVLLVTRPQLALMLLWSMGGSRRSGFSGGGFSGGGGRSGGGGATGSW